MIAAELRGGSKPSLNEALGWIGSRVDDIYGASVGRLEDVWIDPGTGVPRWLLVKEGRFGGRTTLIPFEDATAGAGHVWVPYEREIVREAPEIEAGAPLTQQVETALRSHYSANAPAAISHRRPDSDSGRAAAQGPQPGSAMGTATIRFAPGPIEAGPPEAFEDGRPAPPPQQRAAHPPPRRHVLREQPQAPAAPAGASADPYATAPLVPPAQLPVRPPPPIAAPQPPYQQQPGPQGPDASPPQPYAEGPPPVPSWQSPQQEPEPTRTWEQPQQQPARAWQPQPQPARAWQPQQQPVQEPREPPPPSPIEALSAIAQTGGTHYVEIELSGDLTIRGELRSIRVTPRGEGPTDLR